MEQIRLIEYETAEGKCPFKKWIDSIKNIQTQARILRYVRSLSLGNFNNCKPVGEGVHELKIDFGPGYRVYFGNEGKTIIVLLCGGSKKNQDKDIKLAQKYWAEYKRQALL
ncbi:MAG: type II toxin-antitoxin system RelE/ParE family toxin [Proteobacteria bacterium]|nr:type II toxin-antitoxin system RelE/ParE family toxin [Pseudomonadota bacterium]